MSQVTKIILALIVAAVIVALLRNPSASTGIILSTGAATTGILGTLEGGTSSQRGSFSAGTTKIAYG
jgi:hypothetical protein